MLCALLRMLWKLNEETITGHLRTIRKVNVFEKPDNILPILKIPFSLRQKSEVRTIWKIILVRIERDKLKDTCSDSNITLFYHMWYLTFLEYKTSEILWQVALFRCRWYRDEELLSHKNYFIMKLWVTIKISHQNFYKYSNIAFQWQDKLLSLCDYMKINNKTG